MDDNAWRVGVLKSSAFSCIVTMRAEKEIVLTFSGHTVALHEVLSVEKDSLILNKKELMRLAAQPIGDVAKETPVRRRERLQARVTAEKAIGTRAFLKRVAAEEGISVPRLKQLLDEKPKVNRWSDLTSAKKRHPISARKKSNR